MISYLTRAKMIRFSFPEQESNLAAAFGTPWSLESRDFRRPQEEGISRIPECWDMIKGMIKAFNLGRTKGKMNYGNVADRGIGRLRKGSCEKQNTLIVFYINIMAFIPKNSAFQKLYKHKRHLTLERQALARWSVGERLFKDKRVNVYPDCARGFLIGLIQKRDNSQKTWY